MSKCHARRRQGYQLQQGPIRGAPTMIRESRVPATQTFEIRAFVKFVKTTDVHRRRRPLREQCGGPVHACFSSRVQEPGFQSDQLVTAATICIFFKKAWRKPVNARSWHVPEEQAAPVQILPFTGRAAGVMRSSAANAASAGRPGAAPGRRRRARFPTPSSSLPPDAGAAPLKCRG
jgi:hypothetical protein